MGIFDSLGFQYSTDIPTTEEQAAYDANNQPALDYFAALRSWGKFKESEKYDAQSFLKKRLLESRFEDQTPYGENAVNVTEGPKRGQLHNLTVLAKHSILAAVGSLQLADDVASGNIDADTPGLIAEQLQKSQAQYAPYELKAAQLRMQRMSQRGWKSFQDIWDSLSDVASIAINNTAGMVQLTAQSAGNMIPIMAAAIAGSAAGSVVPVGGQIAGAIGGALGEFAGEASTEAGFRLQEEVSKKLQKEGLAPTEENIAKILNDPIFAKSAIKKARLKAIGTAGADVALGALLGGVAAGPLRRAEKRAAKLIAQEAERTGAELSKATAEGIRQSILGQVTKGQKLRAHLLAMGGEMLSEPAGELSGQLAAGDTVDVGELAGEFLGGLGSSVVETSLHKSWFAGKTTKALAKAASTITYRRIADARNKAKYNKLLNETLEKGEDISKFTNAEDEENYNPLLAIDVLANKQHKASVEERVANLGQAVKIQNDLADQIETLAAQASALKKQLTERGSAPTREERQQHKELLQKLKDRVQAEQAVSAAITTMTGTKGANQSLVSAIKETIKKKDWQEVNNLVRRSFGSESAGAEIDTTLDMLREARNDESISPETKELIDNLETLQKQRNAIKSVSEVSRDVFHGVGAFKGIDFYHQAISLALEKGNLKEAQEQFKDLLNFKNRQQAKARAFKEAIDNLTTGKPISPESQQIIDTLNTRRTNRGLKPYNFNTGPFVSKIYNEVVHEAAALDAAVNTAESLFKTAQAETGVKTANRDTLRSRDAQLSEEVESASDVASAGSQQAETDYDRLEVDNSRVGEKGSSKKLLKNGFRYKGKNEQGEHVFTKTDSLTHTGKRIEGTRVVKVSDKTKKVTDEYFEAPKGTLTAQAEPTTAPAQTNKNKNSKRKTPKESLIGRVFTTNDFTKSGFKLFKKVRDEIFTYKRGQAITQNGKTENWVRYVTVDKTGKVIEDYFVKAVDKKTEENRQNNKTKTRPNKKDKRAAAKKRKQQQQQEQEQKAAQIAQETKEQEDRRRVSALAENVAAKLRDKGNVEIVHAVDKKNNSPVAIVIFKNKKGKVSVQTVHLINGELEVQSHNKTKNKQLAKAKTTDDVIRYFHRNFQVVEEINEQEAENQSEIQTEEEISTQGKEETADQVINDLADSFQIDPNYVTMEHNGETMTLREGLEKQKSLEKLQEVLKQVIKCVG